jgi:hypothetical protein
MRIKKFLTTCQECGRKSKSFRVLKGKVYCYNCWKKHLHIIGGQGKRIMSLDKALSKTYFIRGYGYMSKKGYPTVQALFNVPSILIGHKVKIILAEEKNEITLL